MNNISMPPVGYDGRHLSGKKIDKVVRRIEDIKDIFNDKQACEQLPPDKIVYEVESYLPVPQDSTGGHLTR